MSAPSTSGTHPPFLSSLVGAAKLAADEGSSLSTAGFTSLIDHVVRVFDYLGPLLQVARMDMVVKNGTLKDASGRLPLLADMVQADRAANTVTTKDSCSRNLHRLTSVVTFMRVLLENFLRSPDVTMKEAATAAYGESLSPVHPYMVRTAVWAGMYILPARSSFMQQIGETEESARVHAIEFLKHSKAVEDRVFSLYQGISMPTCQPSTSILAALWGKAPPPEAQAAQA